MRDNPDYAWDDAAEHRRLVVENPWATLVSPGVDGLVASHLPVLLEETDCGISVLSHLGRPDERQHRLGEVDALLIVEGPAAYVSPRWYDTGPSVPTWNFVTLHLAGRPQVLSAEENYSAMSATVDHLERGSDDPFRLAEVAEYAERIALGTVGFRFRADRVRAKAKLSQDKPDAVSSRVVEALADRGQHAVVREMLRVRGAR